MCHINRITIEMIKRNILLIVILMFPPIFFAQIMPPPAGPPDPPGLPIDGFTGVLFLIGIIYGFVKILKNSSS